MKKTNFKKLITSFLLCLSITSLVLMLRISLNDSLIAHAQTSGSEYLQQIGQKTNLPTFETDTHAKASTQPGANVLTSAIYYVLDFFKYLIGATAVIMITITGIKLIMARKKIDDVWPKQKEHLIQIMLAFVIIMIADVVVKKVFFGMEGEVFQSEAQAQLAAQEGTKQLRGIYNAAMMVAGTIAVLMLVIEGIRLVTSAGNEEVQTKVKKAITWIVLGLFLIGIAEFVVLDFVFPKQGSTLPDAEKGKKLIVDFTNFVSAFVAIVSVIMFIYGGVLYVTAFGNDEKTGKAKKIFTGAIIGIILAGGAFAIINTFIQFKPGE